MKRSRFHGFKNRTVWRFVLSMLTILLLWTPCQAQPTQADAEELDTLQQNGICYVDPVQLTSIQVTISFLEGELERRSAELSALWHDYPGCFNFGVDYNTLECQTVRSHENTLREEFINLWRILVFYRRMLDELIHCFNRVTRGSRYFSRTNPETQMLNLP